MCGNGTGAIGCGDQEMFRNCADVKIMSNVGHPPNIRLPKLPEINAPFRTDAERAAESQLVVRSNVCVSRRNTAGKEQRAKINHWCQQNCLAYPPNCDENLCECL